MSTYKFTSGFEPLLVTEKLSSTATNTTTSTSSSSSESEEGKPPPVALRKIPSHDFTRRKSPEMSSKAPSPDTEGLNNPHTRRYAASLPDQQSTKSDRSRKPYTKLRYLQQRSSLERDCTNLRHSSYHPTPEDEAAMAAAIAYKYNMFYSRPASPVSCCRQQQQPCRGRSLERCTGCGGSLLGFDYEDRLLRLEADKASLHLHVSVLSDQIHAQTAKIEDLEKVLDGKRNVLEATEKSLQKELLQRSTLETSKLELMTEISSLRLRQATLERENYELKNGMDFVVMGKPPIGRVVSPPTYSVDGTLQGRGRSDSAGGGIGCGVSGGSPLKQRAKTPPATMYRRTEPLFSTIPRRSQQLEDSNLNDTNHSPTSIERENFDPKFKTSPPKPRGGLLRILSKLKRSNSTGLDNTIAPEPFARGGIRSTAAPRLGWMQPVRPLGPPPSWDSQAVIQWLSSIGLAAYGNEVRRWVKTGQQLLDATPSELERELGLKNPLHRKKLHLAIASLKNPSTPDPPGQLDYQWVVRWLDDIGLPQYKEYFTEHRVDGRVLSNLTAEDLFYLRVTSVLHHASIKRGIQLLRIHRFHPGCLCRRGGIETGAKSVAGWTNHRVMEWLKTIDLAEYAPNLRGSGVHGALMIFEPKFNAELLSTILSIPPSKTLLRRHLCLQLNDLVGRHVVQEKRSLELAPDFTPILPTLKLKPKKFRWRKAEQGEGEELVCGLELDKWEVEDRVETETNGRDKISNI